MGYSLFIKIPQNAIHTSEMYSDFDFEDEYGVLGCADAGEKLVFMGFETDHFAAFDGWKFDTYDKIWAHINIGFGGYGSRLKEKLIEFATVRGLEFRVEA